MAEHDPLLLDHVWAIFENQDDSESPNIVEAAVYLHQQYDFDLDVLPENLYDLVQAELKKQAEESYWDDRASDAIDGLDDLPY